MPCDDTVREWAKANSEFARDIAHAREMGFDAIAVEALSILDEEPERVVTVTGDDRSESRIDGASVQRAKNRFEGRLKLLAKWDPKRYGDAVQLKHANSDGENLPAPMSDLETAAKMAALIASVKDRLASAD
jgi:hypothetical protein